MYRIALPKQDYPDKAENPEGQGKTEKKAHSLVTLSQGFLIQRGSVFE